MNIEAERHRIHQFFTGWPNTRPRVAYERWYGVAREACRQFARRAIVGKRGGVPRLTERQPEATHRPAPAWFGSVTVAAVREKWPDWNGRPMTPLLQVDCTALPFRPETLQDIDVLTVFGVCLDAETHGLHRDLENGASWLIRTYSHEHDSLVAHVPPAELHWMHRIAGYRARDLGWAPKPNACRIAWDTDTDQPPYRTEIGQERTSLIQTMLYRHYQDSAGENWPDYQKDAGGNNWGLFTTEIDGACIEQVLHLWTRNLTKLKIGGWPSFPSLNDDFTPLLPALEVPDGFQFVFQIPDDSGWSWNTSATGVTMALFFRDMTSPTPRWAMFRRRQT